MMNNFNDILTLLSDVLWGYPMIILLFGTHIYLTIRLKFPQRKIFTAIKISLTHDKYGQGDVSQFQALATALAATIGTGNIIGVGTAIAMGGPGAVMWCWLTGVLGIATKYGESLLAVKYRKRSENGYMVGGPMYVLQDGLHCKWAGALFAAFTALAALGIGCTVQANAISTLAHDVMGVSPWITGGIVTFFAALVLLGGIRIIARVCAALVPLMAFVYVIGCIFILCINHEYVWPAINLIVTSAFSTHAVEGGVLGSGIILAARFGIARGLFSNESGLGSAPIVAASAQTKNPVRQALVSASGTFWDTVVICAITGIVIVSCVLSYSDLSHIDSSFLRKLFEVTMKYELRSLDGGSLTRFAFGHIPYVGVPLLMFGLFTFAFSTILGWNLYAQRAVEYLFGYKAVKWYMRFFIVAVFLGSIIGLDTVWKMADIFNALMALPNLVALLLLSKVLVKDTDYYLWGSRIDEEVEESEELGIKSSLPLL